MTCSSSSACLFCNRQYSSIIQRILNLLPADIIRTKCDLNTIAKRSLCIYNLTDDQMIITEEQFLEKQNELDKLKSNLKVINRWPEEIDRLLQSKILSTCNSKISIYKLLQFICDVFTDPKFLEMMESTRNDIHSSTQTKTIGHQRTSNLIRCRIELSLPAHEIGHLIGHKGRLHKSIMEQTGTQIHFDKVSYSIPRGGHRCTDFNWDAFHLSSRVTATIAGRTVEAVENAKKALKELDQTIQMKMCGLNDE